VVRAQQGGAGQWRPEGQGLKLKRGKVLLFIGHRAPPGTGTGAGDYWGPGLGWAGGGPVCARGGWASGFGDFINIINKPHQCLLPINRNPDTMAGFLFSFSFASPCCKF
jgi:hypothetical protein